jgi:hypothetical protein
MKLIPILLTLALSSCVMDISRASSPAATPQVVINASTADLAAEIARLREELRRPDVLK